MMCQLDDVDHICKAMTYVTNSIEQHIIASQHGTQLEPSQQYSPSNISLVIIY